MTKKDYIAIGNALKPYVNNPNIDRGVIDDVINDLCEVLSEDNPQFDKARFINFVYKKEA